MSNVELLGMSQHAVPIRTQELSMQLSSPQPANLTTGQFAAAIGRSPQTILSHHSRSGEAFGIRPRKVGRLLLWPSDQVTALLNGAEKRAA